MRNHCYVELQQHANDVRYLLLTTKIIISFFAFAAQAPTNATKRKRVDAANTKYTAMKVKTRFIQITRSVAQRESVIVFRLVTLRWIHCSIIAINR